MFLFFFAKSNLTEGGRKDALIFVAFSLFHLCLYFLFIVLIEHQRTQLRHAH